ncbi:MAG: hypothetical protein Q4G30_01500 [Actinomycetaceae bacterium]|nr:hypothetical protein [Actinomycetaceae bacterium]
MSYPPQPQQPGMQPGMPPPMQPGMQQPMGYPPQGMPMQEPPTAVKKGVALAITILGVLSIIGCTLSAIMALIMMGDFGALILMYALAFILLLVGWVFAIQYFRLLSKPGLNPVEVFEKGSTKLWTFLGLQGAGVLLALIYAFGLARGGIEKNLQEIVGGTGEIGDILMASVKDAVDGKVAMLANGVWPALFWLIVVAIVGILARNKQAELAGM